jgi:hypothetical protein
MLVHKNLIGNVLTPDNSVTNMAIVMFATERLTQQLRIFIAKRKTNWRKYSL